MITMKDPRKVELRYILLALGLVLLLGMASLPLHLFASAPAASVKLDVSAAGPRQVEDSTVQAIQRDYASAWVSLGRAVDENRADLLNGSFVGTAREQAAKLVDEQKKSGLHQRYVDHGHTAKVTFYSLDGSSMLVQDTAQLEIQQLDGSNVVHSEQVTVHYLALLTPAENSWKVRVLESVPGF
jgi:hypothetical protein